MNFKFQSIIFLFFTMCFLFVQDSLIAQEVDSQLDSLPKKKKLDIDGVPAVGYSPETKFTIGAALIYSYYLAPPTTICRKSSVQLKFVYSTAKQIEISSRWNMFTTKNLYFFRGQTYYQKNTDRHYGFGNGGLAYVVEHVEDTLSNHYNYANFKSKQLYFSLIAARQVVKHLYLGLDYEIESVFDNSFSADRVEFVTPELFNNPIAGTRSGLGFNITYDNRDNVNAPHNGIFASLSNRYYGKAVGSDFKYELLSVDFRYYKSTWKNQVVAVNLRSENRFVEDAEELQIYALSRFGGKDFIKGYFRGTYQDKHLLGFQLEYRALLFKTPWVPYLKAIGVVGMFNGGQVYNKLDDFSLNRFRTSVGFGFRAVIDEEQRISTGVDFAWGLHNKASLDGGQFGMYISLGETF